jgi:hypothetical protein
VGVGDGTEEFGGGKGAVMGVGGSDRGGLGEGGSHLHTATNTAN